MVITRNHSHVPGSTVFLKHTSLSYEKLRKSSYSWWHKAVWFPGGTCSIKSNRQYLMCKGKAAVCYRSGF